MVELYLQYEYWVAVVQLVLAMLGMGAGLQVADFQKVVQQPKAVSLGLMMQLIMVPLIAFGFISYTNLSPGMVIFSQRQYTSVDQHNGLDVVCLLSNNTDNTRFFNSRLYA